MSLLKLTSCILFLSLIFIQLTQKAFAYNTYIKIPLDSIANAKISAGFVQNDLTPLNFSDNLLLGKNSIPFSIRTDQNGNNNYFDTSVNFPNNQSAIISIDVRGSTGLYVLLVAGGTHISSPENPIQFGEINLKYSDGSVLTTGLIEGFNIREWILDDPSNYRVCTDPNIEYVLTGKNTRDTWKTTVIDMLYIPINETYQALILKSIELKDDTADLSGIHFMGMTLENGSYTASPKTVFIPGLGGSWTKRALFFDEKVEQKDWRLTPFFTDEYKALLQTLQNAGLTKGNNLLEFYYDWRQPLKKSGEEFFNFLNSNGEKFNIISHSLGGLVARSCVQQIDGCKDKINKLITAGTPHQGAVDAYYLWNGVVPEKDPLRKTLEETLIKLKGSNVRTIIPSAREILPIFNYINWHPYSQMNSLNKNLFLETLGTDKLSGILTTFSGNTPKSTTELLAVYPPSAIDIGRDLWLDGRPFQKFLGTGDDSVLAKSAVVSGFPDFAYNTWHGGLVSTLDPETNILKIFDLPTDKEIKTAAQNKDWNATVFFLKSKPQNNPLTLNLLSAGTDKFKITCFDQHKNNFSVNKVEDDFFIVENLSRGLCRIDVDKNFNSNYEILIGEINTNDTDWHIIKGSAKKGTHRWYNLIYHKKHERARICDWDGHFLED